jgi:diguanylate cyclase (GGDEF)-like protein
MRGGRTNPDRSAARPFMNRFPFPDPSGFDLRAYERLADLLPRLLAEETLEALLDAIADIVEELVPCSAVLLYEVRESDGALVPLLARGLVARDEPVPLELPRRGLQGLAIASVRPLRSEPEQLWEAGQEGSAVEATAAVPLVVRGQPIGCLAIRRRGVGRLFDDDELRFIARLSDVAAITLDNANARTALAELAETDALTGVLNRRGFLTAFDRVLAQAERDGAVTSVLTVDVDGLKTVNDRFGHPAGDAVLVSVANTLRGRTRRGDVIGRLGGDEFAVVLAKAGADEATEVRLELEESLQQARLEVGGGELVPAASFGVASTGEPGAGAAAKDLLARSDLDMYLRKKSRRRGSAG